MVKHEKPPATAGVRFTVEDRKLIAAIRKNTGTQALSEIIRQGLRALATKEGVSV
jgi:hypothetical protein